MEGERGEKSSCVVGDLVQKAYLDKTEKAHNSSCKTGCACSRHRDDQHAEGSSVHIDGCCQNSCVGKVTKFTPNP